MKKRKGGAAIFATATILAIYSLHTEKGGTVIEVSLYGAEDQYS